MDDRLEAVTNDLRAVADDAKREFGSLTGVQLNWKPAPDSWSIAQCFDHLIRTTTSFYDEFDKVASGTRKNSFWENWSPFTGMCGRWLIKFVQNDSKKVKAPTTDIVPPSEIEPDIIERFSEHINEVTGKLAATSGVDRKKAVLASPFMPIMTYTLDDYYTVMVEHDRRHYRQAKRVMENAGFPKEAAPVSVAEA
jgi:hypothetical protein